MHRVHHGYADLIKRHGAAFVKAYRFNILSAGPISHQIVLAKSWHAKPVGQLQRITAVVLMGVGDQNKGCALNGLDVLRLWQHWIAGKSRVYQKNFVFDLNPKRSVAQPNYLHIYSLLLWMIG